MSNLTNREIVYDISLTHNGKSAQGVSYYEDALSDLENVKSVMDEVTNDGADLHNLETSPRFLLNSVDFIVDIVTANMDHTSDKFDNISGHGLVVDDWGILDLVSGTIPAGLIDGERYWISNVPASDAFKVSLTKGGSVVSITDNGTDAVMTFTKTNARPYYDIITAAITAFKDASLIALKRLSYL